MKKTLTLVLSIFSIIGFSQNENCAFSDGYFYYQVLLISDESPDANFNKNDFILHLETNSSISASDSLFLNEHLQEVFIQNPTSNEDPGQKYLYVISDNNTVINLLNTYTESVTNLGIYCECMLSGGYFHYYVRLITDGIPQSTFNKTDFISHLTTNSNPSDAELNFLNNSIIDSYTAFPSSQTESLQKTVIVVSDYDLLVAYLYNFPLSFNQINLICGEAELLSISDNLNSSNNITIFPNPVVENSIIKIDKHLHVEKLFIYDLTGKILIKKTLEGVNSIMINEFNLNPGFYFFKFKSNNAYIVKKIIVK